MRCEEAIEYLHLEADGELLSERTGRQLNEHVSGCAACQKAREELQALSQMLLVALPQSVPLEFASRVRGRVEAPGMRWQQQLIGLAVRPEAQLAALACLAVILASVLPWKIPVLPHVPMTEWWNNLSASVTLPARLPAWVVSSGRVIGLWCDVFTAKLGQVSDALSTCASAVRSLTIWLSGVPSWWARAGFVLAATLNLFLAASRSSKPRQFVG